MHTLLIWGSTMRTRYLFGLLAVLLLLLAVWLVPMALAAAGGSATHEGGATSGPSSSTQCPFLQAHPWLDPHGQSGGGAPAGSSQVIYY
jgi:hypothetical protein